MPKSIQVLEPKHLGDYLKVWRETAGISQLTIAEKIGCTPQFVSNWECGHSDPPLKVLRQLANFYGISPDKVFDALLENRLKKIRINFTKTFYES